MRRVRMLADCLSKAFFIKAPLRALRVLANANHCRWAAEEASMDLGPPVCIGIPLARKPVLAVFFFAVLHAREC